MMKQEEIVSEATENFANEFEKKMATPQNPCLDEITLHWLRLAFKAGVKWQKEQDDEFYAKVGTESIYEFTREYEEEANKRADGVTKETLYKELEEEIKMYFNENWKDMKDGDPLASKVLSELTEIAKHFSEWQKKKMI